jgi:cell division protein FtsN
MLEEPQIVEVPPSGANPAQNAAPGTATNNAANGIAVAPRPSTGDNTTAANKPQSASAPRQTPPQTLANNQPSKPVQAPPTASDANTGYFLQVGAYKTAADAEQQRARLAFQGFESKVTQRDAGGVTYYRVRVGPFAKFDDMNSVRQRLSDAGVDTAVIRFSKQ